MRKAILLAACAAALSSCRGTIPQRDAPAEQDIAAILIGSRFVLAGGETSEGLTHINLESEGGRNAEVYRLPIAGTGNFLYLLEPGIYHFAPTRSFFGSVEEEMTIRLDGRDHRIPFPRELLRQPPCTVRRSKILALGVLEARLMPALPGQKPQIRVSLDDTVEARRQLVQATIQEMMDPRRPAETRESAISWSRALQNSLMEILSEQEKRPLFKPAP